MVERVTLHIACSRHVAEKFREYVERRQREADERGEPRPTQGHCLRELVECMRK